LIILVCSEKIPKCKECSDSKTCLACENSFFLDNSANQCISCESETNSDTENGRDQCNQNKETCNYDN